MFSNRYSEFGELIKQMGSGLKHYNLIRPIQFDDHKRSDGQNYHCVGIYSRNRYEWLVAQYGIYYDNGTVVPLYDTLGPESVLHIIKEVGLKVIICGICEGKKLLNILEDNNNKISENEKMMEELILLDESDEEIQSKCSKLSIHLLQYNDIITQGKSHLVEPEKPTSDDAAMVMYTSGSTGLPKGVILTHMNISSVSQSACWHHKEVVGNPSIYYLSYLPLPHAFEQFLLSCFLSGGSHIGFYSGDKNLVMEDVSILHPTIFVSVPRIFTRMKDTIEKTIKKQGKLINSIFENGLKVKMNGLKNGYIKNQFYDSIIFDTVKRKIGFDRIKLIMSGSAPLLSEIIEFLRCVLSCPVFEGYGMTESSGGLCVAELEDYKSLNHCGGPIKASEVRLMSIREKGYLISDKIHESNNNVMIECNGRGEICFRGYNRSIGYFRNKELTYDTIDSDGWFHSGDVGLFDKEGKLHIIDRIKNIIKLSQGEYIAVEKLENIYQNCKYIDQIFVYGDSYKNSIVAVIVPDRSSLKILSEKFDLKDNSIVELCENEKVKEEIMKELNEIWKLKKLNGIERISGILLESEAFTVEDKFMTPTMKLQRHNLYSHYEDKISELYKNLPKRN